MRASPWSPGRRRPGQRRSIPSSAPEAAVAALGRDLLSFARLGPGDPADGWRRHAEQLAERAARLTALDLRELRLTAPGTDLRLALPEGTSWRGGINDVRGHRITPNIPTEEVFTSPDQSATSGPFRCTRPLALAGRVIEGIAGEFKRGRLVRIEADDEGDREFLAAYLARDRGASRLGELALVDSSSRVGAVGRPFFTTLLDENAAAHIAFGLGFGDCRAPGAPPPNRSVVHLDVMIGSPEMDVEAVDAQGQDDHDHRRRSVRRRALTAAGTPSDEVPDRAHGDPGDRHRARDQRLVGGQREQLPLPGAVALGQHGLLARRRPRVRHPAICPSQTRRVA